jgi:hypothetical protein
MLEVGLEMTEAELAVWEERFPEGRLDPGDRDYCMPADIVNQRCQRLAIR